MWHLGMLGLATLVAALLTPVAWLLVRLSGLLPYLVQATQLRLFPLHLLAGLFGCAVGWVLMHLLAAYTGTGARGVLSRVMGIMGGGAGAFISSLLFFPLVALF